MTPRFVQAVAGVFAAVLASAALAAPAPNLLAPQPGDMGLGDPKAKLKVVEYASITCPHCGRFNNEVFPAFKAKYVDTGKVYYVLREIPTEPADLAAAGFLVARCAPPDKYFAVIDALFQGQAKLFETGDARSFLVQAGKAGGLDEAAVEACVKDKARLAALNARVKAADQAKISGTPTFLVGSRRLEGEQTLAELAAAIDPQLARR